LAQRKSYGNTWWGQQFLNALRKIDYSNRLPRGKTYANKGAVLSIAIDGVDIRAKVQGRRYMPYQQNLRLKPFRPQERTAILDCIVENPFLLSQLLNRSLPPSLDEKLRERGIAVFPTDWSDMEARCSCPDWALPCKHLAAVIYLLANEIDQNPFRVFEWRGLDLVATLEVMGIVSPDAHEQQLPLLNHQLFAAPIENDRSGDQSFWLEMDFARIADCHDSLSLLLPPNPPFYAFGDFKEVFLRQYRQLKKEVQKFHWEFESLPELPNHIDDVTLLLDDTGQPLDLLLEAHHETLSLLEYAEDGLMSEWLRYLEEIPIFNLSQHSHSVAVWRMVYQFCLILLERSACIPEVLKLTESSFRLRWEPISPAAGVSPLMEQLQEQMSPEMVLMEYSEVDPSFFLEPGEQLRWIISLVLEELIRQMVSVEGENRLASWFWQDPLWTEQRIGWRETPYAVQQWLSRFSLEKRSLSPVLQVLDEGWGFSLRLMVRDHTEKHHVPVLLEEFMETADLKDKAVLLFLQDLAMLGEYVPRLSEALGERLDSEITLNSEELLELLENTASSLEWLGIELLLPKALQKLLRPQLSLALDENRNVVEEQTYLSLEQILRFDWQIAIGDQTLGRAEFIAEIKGLRGLVRMRDHYVVIDPDEIQKLLKKLQNPPQLDAFGMLQASLAEEYEGTRVLLSAAARKRIEDLLTLKSIAPPKDLMAELRPYQQRGYEWLYKNRQIGFGSLLADDMGLGKTLQVITLLLKLKEEGQLGEQKALVVAPTSLLNNWAREIEKFAPELKASIYHGTGRKLDPKSELTITSYGIARSDQKKLSAKPWEVLVIDEAQQIKNPNAKISRALKKIPAQQRIAMSGTPVENRLSEYWSLFDFANHGYLTPLNSFKKEYIQPIEKERDQYTINRFKTITAPFIMRRLKTDKSIISDLPEKIVQDQICHLSKEQTALYQSVVNHNLSQLEELEGIARSGMLFKLMTALKQVCNHPVHYLKKGEVEASMSGKSEMLLALVENIIENGDKALIFTQYTEMGGMLQVMLQEAFGEEVPFLYGGLSRKARDEMVQDFQTKPYQQLMLLSLKAAGTGLNLTAANHVIHYDLWWNPAVENQATDRAFRIGQDQNVWVHRLITAHTFEEKINEMIQQKAELANLTVSTGEKWIGDLSNREITRLFELG
jgi:uncharacterized Zn finger protein/superfamily II DNA or RNA helicase